MEVYVKDFASWRTIKKVICLGSDLVLDSLDKENSTITIAGTAINRRDAGNWLIVEGGVYLIHQVKPQEERTALTLLSPLDAFTRKIPFVEQNAAQTIGGFIASMLRAHWVACDDPAYAIPYLTVSESDTAPFVSPELDNSGLFDLAAYCRLVRKTHRVKVSFQLSGEGLACKIVTTAAAYRQVSFADGRSQLKSVDYAVTGVAKITAIQDDIETVWYLSEAGEISQKVPAKRAVGSWETISVSSGATVADKVTEMFAKSRSGHKVEFWSSLELAVQDSCRFLINGEYLTSYISCKRKSRTDTRYYYKAGELATTATEKLKGVKT